MITAMFVSAMVSALVMAYSWNDMSEFVVGLGVGVFCGMMLMYSMIGGRARG